MSDQENNFSTPNIIIHLLPEIEVQICGILIENKICEYIMLPKSNSMKSVHNKFSNMRVLEPYKSKVGYVEIDAKIIASIRDLYPTGSDRKGDIKTIQTKLKQWLDENTNYTLEDVISIMKMYVEDRAYTGQPLFDLNNIFYKREGAGVNKSPFIAIAEKYFSVQTEEEDTDFEI